MGIDMSTAERLKLVTVEEYLAAELASPTNHEYLGGIVYAMATERNAHTRIAGNVFRSLSARLRRQPFQPFASDTKIRIRLPRDTRFYYPDVSVVSRTNPESDSFQDAPALIVEVLSQRTRRIDGVEKWESYLTIPSLGVYALVEQDEPALVAFRRRESGFVREVYEGLEAVIPLPEVGTELPLAEIYTDVEFLPTAAIEETS